MRLEPIVVDAAVHPRAHRLVVPGVHEYADPAARRQRLPIAPGPGWTASSGVRSPNATTWIWRGSIHAVSVFAVSPRPAPSTPETMTSTGPRRIRDRSNCASSSASRRRGSSRAYTSLATRWPISADSSIVGSGSVPERLGLGELPPGLGQAFELARAHRRGPAADDARRARKLDVIAGRGQELVDQRAAAAMSFRCPSVPCSLESAST